MLKRCPQCQRILQLNETNFRKCNGSWRNKCRKCQNEHKRVQYRLRKADKVKSPKPHKVANSERLKALIAYYDHISEVLDAHGLEMNSPARIVDHVLARAGVTSGRKTA